MDWIFPVDLREPLSANIDLKTAGGGEIAAPRLLRQE
jgi:hypothetical protein